MSQPIPQSAPLVWRVKKADNGSIYGPIDVITLKEWAHSAQIAPGDFVDMCDEHWRAAPEIEFLEMIWKVPLDGEEVYGPTSVGTLREFLGEGLISEKTQARNVRTSQAMPVGAVLASIEMEKRRASRQGAPEQKKSTASLAIEMAKEQRIRQLEEDLRELRQEHEALTQKYRQLTLAQQEASRSGRR